MYDYYDLPTTAFIAGKEYEIRNKGDFRVILDCFKALDDEELPEMYRVYTALVIFYDCFDDITDVINTFTKQDDLLTAVNEMYTFFNCGQNNITINTKYKLFDWQQDAHLIFAEINKIAGKEIRAEKYLHWWSFMGYFAAIGEGTFSTIISIRNKIINNKKLEKYEREFKRNNPHYFNWRSKNAQQIKDDEYIRQLWNSNSEHKSG